MHEDLWDIVDSNAQDGEQAKAAIAIDAFPGLGKTTAVLAFAKKFHQWEIRTEGTPTSDRHERWPACRVGLTGNTSMRDFNRAMLEFFAHRALDSVLSCQVKLLIIDDLHFLRWRAKTGVEVSNHFNYIANEFPVTLLFVGVGLAERGLFSEGSSYADAVLVQAGRRTTALGTRPFTVSTDRAAAANRADAGDRRPGGAGRQLSGHARR